MQSKIFYQQQRGPNFNAEAGTSMELDSDSFDNSSKLAPRDYYRLLVNEVLKNASGGCALIAQCQTPISAATQEFMEASKKDPISLLNIYCTSSGQATFPFYDYEITKRPDKNKFVMVTELDGKPVFGALSSTKKDAKKSCALRLIDQLMEKQRLSCIITEAGKKVKHSSNVNSFQTLSLEQKGAKLQQNQGEMMSQLNDYYKHMPQYDNHQMENFAEDVDLNNEKEKSLQPKLLTMQTTPGGFTRQSLPPICVPEEIIQIFEQRNSIPIDCKNSEKFLHVRSHAFRLYYVNAFAATFDEMQIMDEEIREKLCLHGIGSKDWNAVSFITKCIQRVNSWVDETAEKEEQLQLAENEQKKSALINELTEQEQETTEGPQSKSEEEVKKESQNRDQLKQQNLENETTFIMEETDTNQQQQQQSLSHISVEYFVFSIPPFRTNIFVCLALLNENEIFYGRMAESKAKAKIACAEVLAQRFVELGWANVPTKPKTKKRKVPTVDSNLRYFEEENDQAKLSKAKKRKEEQDGDESIESLAEEDNQYKFLFTFHPDEQLDPRTHFLLAINSSKNSVQLLNEICARLRFTVLFEEGQGTNVQDDKSAAQKTHGRFIFFVRMQSLGIPGLPPEYSNQRTVYACGVQERTKRAAKQSAARAVLDQLIRSDCIQVPNENVVKALVKNALFSEFNVLKSDSSTQTVVTTTIVLEDEKEQITNAEGEKAMSNTAQQMNVENMVKKNSSGEDDEQEQIVQEHKSGSMII